VVSDHRSRCRRAAAGSFAGGAVRPAREQVTIPARFGEQVGCGNPVAPIGEEGPILHPPGASAAFAPGTRPTGATSPSSHRAKAQAAFHLSLLQKSPSCTARTPASTEAAASSAGIAGVGLGASSCRKLSTSKVEKVLKLPRNRWRSRQGSRGSLAVSGPGHCFAPGATSKRGEGRRPRSLRRWPSFAGPGQHSARKCVF